MHWNDKGIFEIADQEISLFHGKKSWLTPKKDQMRETFSRFIRADNKIFIIAEHKNGFMFGDILSDGKIMMYYVVNRLHTKAMVYENNRQ